MGWSFTSGATRAEVIAELTGTRTSGTATWTTLAHCTRGSTLYYVCEVTKPGAEPERFIGISLLGKERDYGWGSKDMTESEGPYAYACPLAYLDMVPDPGHYATEWRAKVRAYHVARDLSRYPAGAKLRLREGCRPREITVTGRKGKSILGTDPYGTTYRIAPRLLEGAEVL